MTPAASHAEIAREGKSSSIPSGLRRDWSVAEASALYGLPFNDLLFKAQTIHRAHFDPNRVQLSRLLSIKTGGCPEDCAYCSLETCMTLGMLDRAQSEQLSHAGLDYYNHNIDTSERYYSEIITTRNFADRLTTLDNVRAAGMKVCCGGIVGMGEEANDRIAMLTTLANLPEHPESVPINMLIPIPGTPLADAEPISPLDFVRTVALARIMMPQSVVRLSAGRTAMSDEMQALCFFAGANSIFVGDTLLTAGNPENDKDMALFDRLGLQPMELNAVS
jgi:biotin synthase